MSSFDGVDAAAPIEVFALTQAYTSDAFDKKVNLGVGGMIKIYFKRYWIIETLKQNFRSSAYRTDEGKPWVLPVVRKVEESMAKDHTLNKEYLPVLGIPAFTSAATKMLLGAESPAIVEGRATGIQCLSGTGALRVSAEFLTKILGRTIIYSSDPTWGTYSEH